MAKQFISQLPPTISSAILGNAGTLISFTLGSEDSEIIAKEFYPKFSAENLQNLPKHNVYIKLSIDGSSSIPFSAETLHEFERSSLSHREKIIGQTRLRYATPKEVVESKILQWHQW
ncbi:hypothetical protein TRIP_C60042 [Candidatus Zixiibacteriota bacterium]|nr:hypothetical protein TRIP_C60042 [candidate division Zixibacteria bacterium]